MKPGASTQGSSASQAISQTEAVTLAALFKALSDPSRLILFSSLTEGEGCVHELTDRHQMEQSAVSHQLRTLRNQNLVETRRDGRHIHYSLVDSHVRDVFTFALEHIRHASPDWNVGEAPTKTQ